jgi:hypothetical protein
MRVLERQRAAASQGGVERQVPVALVALVLVLAAAGIALGPTTARVCGALEDSQCGP